MEVVIPPDMLRMTLIDFLTDREGSSGRGRRNEDIHRFERCGEIASNQRTDFLRLAVVGVVVPARQCVGAQHDSTLHFGSEADLTCSGHDLFDGRLAVIARTKSIAHAVEASEIARCFRRQDQVVGAEGVVEVWTGDLDHLGTQIRQDRDGLVETFSHARLVALP